MAMTSLFLREFLAAGRKANTFLLVISIETACYVSSKGSGGGHFLRARSLLFISSSSDSTSIMQQRISSSLSINCLNCSSVIPVSFAKS